MANKTHKQRMKVLKKCYDIFKQTGLNQVTVFDDHLRAKFDEMWREGVKSSNPNFIQKILDNFKEICRQIAQEVRNVEFNQLE